MSIKETFKKARETVKGRSTLLSQEEEYWSQEQEEKEDGSEMATIMVSDFQRGNYMQEEEEEHEGDFKNSYSDLQEEKGAISIEEKEEEIEETEEAEDLKYTKRHLLANRVLRSGKVVLSDTDSDNEEMHYDFIEDNHNKMRSQIVHLSEENKKLQRKNVILMSYIQENGPSVTQSIGNEKRINLAQRCSQKYNGELRRRINSKITKRIKMVLNS